jgi:hypothetical protein
MIAKGGRTAMSDFSNTEPHAAISEKDNLVLFPSAQSFAASHDRRDPIQTLGLEIEAAALPEESLDALMRVGHEVQGQDLSSLNISEMMELTKTQVGILKETSERIDYLLREIESVIPKRK